MVLSKTKSHFNFKLKDGSRTFYYAKKINYLKHKKMMQPTKTLLQELMVKEISSPRPLGVNPQSIQKYLKGGKNYE